MFGKQSEIKEQLEQCNQRLQTCLARLHTIMTRSPHGILIVDMSSKVLFANPAAATIFNCKTTELLGKQFDFPVGQDKTTELKLKSRDDKTVAVEAWAIETEWNADKAYFIALHDITERNKNEQELRKLYRAMMESPVMVMVTDAHGNIEYVNPSFTETTGYTFAEVAGKNPRFLKSDKTSPEIYKELWETMADGKVWRGEFINSKKNGDLYSESVSIAPVMDTSGVITNFIAVKEDITERKRMEESLRESEERFRATFEQAAVGIAHVDQNGRLLRINQKYCDIVGYTEEELKALTFQEITHPEDLEENIKHLQLLLAGNLRNYSLEKRYIHKNGSTVWVNLTVSLVTDAEGKYRYHVAIIVDITARKQAEEKIEMLNADLAARASELEAANRELEAFNYTVSDDLRRPILNINSFCQVIQELCGSNMDKQCSGYLQRIYDWTLQMSHHIDTLLNFSRLASSDLRREAVDLSELAKSVTADLKMAEPERQVTFRIAEGLTTNGDPHLLWVVLENLLSNAWKYTGRRDEAVIEFGMTEIEGMPVYFVRDNGTGFDMAYAEKLFIPFQHLPGTDEYKGHGIGLATVERIIRRLGGRVWAEGEPGKGATFWFTVQAHMKEQPEK